MTLVDPMLKEKLSPQVRTEAAAWLARLHGPKRNARVEEGFRRWLETDPSHALAFELVTDVWEGAGRIRRPVVVRSLPGVKALPMVYAAAAALILCIGSTWLFLRDDAVMTAIGEQRILTLEDGSRMFLNTVTRAQLLFNGRERRVKLERGEALFEVAPEASRPFVVVAGEQQILALGTSFLVRRDDKQVAVTLMEGKVQVDTLADAAESRAARVLEPGQRVTYVQGERPQMDQPVLEKVTAWRQGQVVIDDISLGDAMAEMNRYSKQRLRAEHPEAATIRISGTFRAGDSLNFAKAVAKTYQMKVTENGGEILLSGVPSGPRER